MMSVLRIPRMAVTVDSKWLAANLDNPSVVILDTRGNMPYRFDHIKNALPLSIEPGRRVWRARRPDDSKGGVEPDVPRASRTAILDREFQTWQVTGLPVTRDPSQPAPAQFKSRPRADIRVDAESIKTRMGDPTFVVIDARTAQ